MQASQRQTIEELRARIRRIEQRPARASGGVASGWTDVDAAVRGGFPRGALSALTGEAGSGKTALALAVVREAMAETGLAAWIDARSELYAPGVRANGVDLSRLLIVRPGRADAASPSGIPSHGTPGGARDALWAAEAVLASGAFSAVVLDVPLVTGARSRSGGGATLESMLRRLLGAADKGGAVGLWLGEPGGLAPPVAVRLEVSRGVDGVRVRRAIGRERAREVAGHAA